MRATLNVKGCHKVVTRLLTRDRESRSCLASFPQHLQLVNILSHYRFCVWQGQIPGGAGLPYITDGDARRNFQKKPLKVTILGVAPANFIP